MKNTFLTFTAVVALAAAAEEVKPPPAKPAPTVRRATVRSNVVVYIPPKVNAPRITTGPGTRNHEVTFGLVVLAPDHVGWTMEEQPSLYWFQASAAPAPLELTMAIPGEPNPILRQKLEDVRAAQVHQINLKQHQLHLRPDVEYRWSIAVVVDPEHRSNDIVASGAIMRKAPLGNLSQRAKDSSPELRMRALAEAGFWYDAFQLCAEQTKKDPQNLPWREQLAAFTLQIGKTNVANYYSAIY